MRWITPVNTCYASKANYSATFRAGTEYYGGANRLVRWAERIEAIPFPTPLKIGPFTGRGGGSRSAE
jgi:hypothetical protein